MPNLYQNILSELQQLRSDAAINPNFTQEELDKEKAKLIENVKSGESSAASVASRVRNVLAYGKNHPYGEYITEQTINNVSLNDIKSYYSDFFTPANAYMVVSGDVKSKDVKKIIKKYFGSWSQPSPLYSEFLRLMMYNSLKSIL